MLFTSPLFFAFFAVVLLVYWNLPKNHHRKWFLLLASYVFYGCWDYRFVAMLFIISFVDYWLARWIARTDDTVKRKLYFITSLSMNLGVLGFFKYCNFFVASAVSFANSLGIHLSQPTLHIILPVGVSFITFQSLSYIIDVYRGQFKPVRLVGDYLLAAAFFPQLVAGPIMRPAYFLPQLAAKRTMESAQLKGYFLLFLIGFFKKTAIADNIGVYVDLIFADPSAYSQQATIAAVWLYAAQIYCDFSGYTDMAIAVAGFMGFRMVTNFNAPYLSTSIQEFWRRWHMSLSFWIRDYIYISLGGRSKHRLVTYRNLLITMLAGGLWHGAAWTFVVWGGLHGLGLVVNRDFNHRVKQKMGWLLGWFLTINFVCAVWIFFRATDFATAWVILKRYLLIEAGSGQGHFPLWFMMLPLVLLGFEYMARRLDMFMKVENLTPRLFAVFYGIAWAVTLALLPLNNAPFIYFQF